MKKIISLFLCLALSISLASCELLAKLTDKKAQDNSDQTVNENNPTSDVENSENNEENNDQDAENHSAIINYYKELALYNQYLEEKAIYDQKKAEYDEYLRACEKYAVDLISYEKYIQDYNSYISIKNRNDEKIAKYEAELEEYKLSISYSNYELQVKLLDDALFSKVTYLEREFYGALFSSLVDEVLANNDKLIAAFGNKVAGPIDDSKRATENIRLIFRPTDGVRYEDLKTVDDKYSFYTTNYQALCDNIYLLSNSLYKIYTTTGMVQLFQLASETLGREDYTERVVIFIAQAVCISEALIDTPLTYTDGNGNICMSSEMRFDYRTKEGVDVKNRSIEEILEGEEFVADTNCATPGSNVSIKMPVKPTLEELPPEPTTVAQPIEPVYVPHPGEAPKAVDKPIPPEGMIIE